MSVDSFVNEIINEVEDRKLQSDFLKEYNEAMEKHREEKEEEQNRLLEFAWMHGYRPKRYND